MSVRILNEGRRARRMVYGYTAVVLALFAGTFLYSFLSHAP